MRLIIAEKPSLGRAIAEALGGQQVASKHAIVCRDTTVTWCTGHLLGLAEPECYDPRYSQRRVEDLPIVPDSWQLTPLKGAGQLLTQIQRHLTRASEVVHAGDPAREGQLLVDELLLYCGWIGPTRRLWVQDLNPEAVRRALREMKPNEHYQRLSSAAVARQRADWLYGINLSRRFHALVGDALPKGGVAVGRVQTPLLTLIAQRDAQVQLFRPHEYFAVSALVSTGGHTFWTRWTVPERLVASTDDAGRITDRNTAEDIAAQLAHDASIVTKCEQRQTETAPPLPLSLPRLQAECSRRFGFSASDTLKCAQSLYSRHRLLSYPRSDCSYLPESQLKEAQAVLDAIAVICPELAQHVPAPTPRTDGRAWDDTKVCEHHALVPTGCRSQNGKLSDHENRVYALVALYYLAQFARPYRVRSTSMELLVGDERLSASSTEVLERGWKAMLARTPGKEPAKSQAPLPCLPLGAEGRVLDARVLNRLTTSPNHHTDASVVELMTDVTALVSNEAVRRVLQGKIGIGTAATRAATVDKLLAQGLLMREGKTLRSTMAGRKLVARLPALVTSVNTTAIWEEGLRRVEVGEMTLEQFMGSVVQQVSTIVESKPEREPPAPRTHEGAGSAPKSRTRTRPQGKCHKQSRSSEIVNRGR